MKRKILEVSKNKAIKSLTCEIYAKVSFYIIYYM